MCIKSQTVTKDGISITFVNDVVYNITRAQILALYQQQTGNAAARKAATITAIKQQMVDAATSIWLSVDRIDFRFNEANADENLWLFIRS